MCISKAAWHSLTVCVIIWKAICWAALSQKSRPLSACCSFVSPSARAATLATRVAISRGNCTLGGGEGALETRENSFILMCFYSKYTFSQRRNSLRDVFWFIFISHLRYLRGKWESPLLLFAYLSLSGHSFLIMRRRTRYFIKFLKLLKKQRIFIADRRSKPGLVIFRQRLIRSRWNPFVEGFYEARLLGIIKGGSQHLSLSSNPICMCKITSNICLRAAWKQIGWEERVQRTHRESRVY